MSIPTITRIYNESNDARNVRCGHNFPYKECPSEHCVTRDMDERLAALEAEVKASDEKAAVAIEAKKQIARLKEENRALVEALRRAQIKLSAYVGVCKDDTELPKVIGMAEIALGKDLARADAKGSGEKSSTPDSPSEAAAVPALTRPAGYRELVEALRKISMDDRPHPMEDWMDIIRWYQTTAIAALALTPADVPAKEKP